MQRWQKRNAMWAQLACQSAQHLPAVAEIRDQRPVRHKGDTKAKPNPGLGKAAAVVGS